MTSPDFGLSIIASWIANKIDNYFKNKNNHEEIIENKTKPKVIKQQETEALNLSKRFQKLLILIDFLHNPLIHLKTSIKID